MFKIAYIKNYNQIKNKKSYPGIIIKKYFYCPNDRKIALKNDKTNDCEHKITKIKY